jgi:hypothetical protein
MSIFLIKAMEAKVEKVWIDNISVYIQTSNGDVFSESFEDYPRLRNATPKQRAAFEYNDVGIRWDGLDEDLCFEGFMNKKRHENNGLYDLFKKHPELNISAFARSVNIPQSVMGSYLCGIKKPSRERLKQIENKLHSLGNELSLVQL